MVIYRPGKVEYTDLGVTLENIVGVTGQARRFLFTGSQFVLFEYDTSDDSSELNYWDTDGSEAVSRLMEEPGVLDVVFDKEDNRYYALKYNGQEGFEGTGGTWSGDIEFFDDFNQDNVVLNPNLWVVTTPAWTGFLTNTEDEFGSISEEDTRPWLGFKVDNTLDRLSFLEVEDVGIAKTGMSYDGDFQAWTDIFMTRYGGSDSVFSLKLIDVSEDVFYGEKNNQVSEALFRGPHIVASGTYGTWGSSHSYFDVDNTGGKWSIRNFRIRNEYVDDISYGLTNGSYTSFDIEFYSYEMSDDTNYFYVKKTSGTTLSSGVVNNTEKSFQLVHGPIGFTLLSGLSGDLGNLVGSSVRLNIRIDNTPQEGDSDLTSVSGTSGFRLGVGLAGTNIYARRDRDGSVGGSGWQNIRVYNSTAASSRNLSVEMYGTCSDLSHPPNLYVDDFTLETTGSGNPLWPGVPSLSIQTFDLAGDVNSITGITDTSGYAVRRLDVIKSPVTEEGSLQDLRTSGVVAITSDQKTKENGGVIYVLFRRNEDSTPSVYRYKKTSFPISDIEDGSSAELAVHGSVENLDDYRLGSFSYSAYEYGQVSYTTDNWADPGRGQFISTVLSGTLSGTRPRESAWIQGSDFLCWNVNDYDSMYGVTTTGTLAGKINLYNMTPDTASFVNVISSNKLLPAGTNENSVLRAEVMNVYGRPLDNKTVAFTITAGDGSVSPPSAVTNASGVATTTYTVGTAVTTSTITVTVNI